MRAKRGTALVTGVGRREGIGFEVCRRLAQEGFMVILTARTLEKARPLAEELSADGLDVEPVALDVTHVGRRRGVVEYVRTRAGALDVLVNHAAGSGHAGETVEGADLSDARIAFETTVLASWGLTQAFLPLLRESAHPRIVNVSSGAGSYGDMAFGLRTGNGVGPSYAVAKAALNALTVLMAKELADSKVLVNAVCPGFTATFPGAEQMGARPVTEGAASVIWAAMLPDDGPRGGLFRDGKEVPW